MVTVTNVALINYEIPDDLHRRAKAAAALQGVSLKAFLIDALSKATDAADRKKR
jgi:predicted HicB family RNase H-like nuclease